MSIPRILTPRVVGFSIAILAVALPGPIRAAAAQPSQSALKLLSLDELMDIQVTSVSRRPEKLIESASAIQVITAADIRRSGAVVIPEVLRLAGNLNVAQKNSHDWGISARGFNTELANKLLVLMDGRTVYTPLFSGVSWPVQDYLLEDIDRIEVISGPGGTLWGANAVNGIISISSKDSKSTQGFHAEAGGGSAWRDFVGARYGGSFSPGVSFRVYGKYLERDAEVTQSGKDAGDAWRMRRGGFRIDGEALPQSHVTLQGDIYRADEGLAAGGASLARGENLLARWTRELGADSDLSLQLYYDRTHVTSTVPAGVFSPVGIFTDDLRTYDLDFQHRFRLGGRNHVVWGFGFRRTADRVENAPGLAFVPTSLDQELSSGFVQDEFALRSNVVLTAGTKVEHNDYTGYEMEPSVRLQWNVSDSRLLWTSVSRAVRMPSRVDRDIRQPNPPPAVLKGGDAFVSETVVAYEAGFRGQLGPSLSVSLAAFYNSYDHVRSLGFTPTTILPLFFQNDLEGKTHGFEFTSTYEFREGWRVRGTYNLLNEHLRIRTGGVDLNHALNETSDPQQQASLLSSMDLPHGVTFDVGPRWVVTLHNNNGGVPGSVPSYTELEVRLGWHPSADIDFSVFGQNLLDHRHAEYGTPGPGRVEIGRNIYGRVAWRF